LYELPPYIGNLTNLRSLNVGYNRLTTLPLTITNLHYLNELYVYRNQIQYIPWQIRNMPDLYISDWGNPCCSGNYYYDDYYYDDGFIDFVETVAGLVYQMLSIGWNASLGIDYHDHRFQGHLWERAIVGGREHLSAVAMGGFKQHGYRNR
jgi:Leucine-rich repeat (LRR) protein